MPTLVLQGDNEQIVPIDASGRKSVKIIPDATLKALAGASHGMCTVDADKVNAALIEFLQD